ncbi:MAG: J domain-containing protein [Actinomycetota bacterium]
MATENLYTLLGVKSDASTRQIRDAYRALARTLHPDTRSESTGHDDLNKMARVNDAWHVLSDSRRRKEYDQSLGVTQSGSESQATEYVAPVFYSPSPFPWRGLVVLLILGITAVLVFGASNDVPSDTPDQLLQAGSCVIFDGAGAVSEVSCATTHDAIVRQLIGYDMTCPSDTESYRDRQGMGTACVDRLNPSATSSKSTAPHTQQP